MNHTGIFASADCSLLNKYLNIVLYEGWKRIMKFFLSPASLPRVLWAQFVPKNKQAKDILSSILSIKCKGHKNTIKRWKIICFILNINIFYAMGFRFDDKNHFSKVKINFQHQKKRPVQFHHTQKNEYQSAMYFVAI